MDNREIEAIVKKQPDLFKPITIAFLSVESQNYIKMMNGYGNHSAHERHLASIVYHSKMKTVADLKTEHESKYSNSDWAQIVSVIYQVYMFHDPKAERVFVRFFKHNLKNRVILAHYLYCCQQFIKTGQNKAKAKEDLSKIIFQIDVNLNALRQLHSMLI